MSKLFSIILPVYNAEKKIVKTIESVLNQEDTLYELIIVDGRSNDNTLKIIDKYYSMYPNLIKKISEPDDGIYDAMNKGIKIASGQYLYFLGAGDALRKGILKNIESHLNFKPELIYGNVFWERGGYIISGEFNKEKICFMNLCHQSIFYYKEVFSLMGKYDLQYHVSADSLLNLKCFGSPQIDVRYINIIIANYEGGGYSTQVRDKYLIDKGDMILKYLGKGFYDLYNSTDCKVWLEDELKNFIDKSSNVKVAIFGAGGLGQGVNTYITEINKNRNKKIEVSFFLDNGKEKWGKQISGKSINKPHKNYLDEVDAIIVASMPGKMQIREQLLDMGVRKDKIVDAV